MKAKSIIVATLVILLLSMMPGLLVCFSRLSTSAAHPLWPNFTHTLALLVTLIVGWPFPYIAARIIGRSNLSFITSFLKRSRLTIRLVGILLLLSVLLLSTCLVLYLNSEGQVFFPPLWQRVTLSNIQPEIGFAYTAATNRPELSSHEHPSSALVLENGVSLSGPRNAIADNIRTKGNGQFSFWHDSVYFSTSDNSNPRTNGRRYEICYPLYISSAFVKTLFVIASIIISVSVFWLTLVVNSRKQDLLSRLWVFTEESTSGLVNMHFKVRNAVLNSWGMFDLRMKQEACLGWKSFVLFLLCTMPASLLFLYGSTFPGPLMWLSYLLALVVILSLGLLSPGVAALTIGLWAVCLTLGGSWLRSVADSALNLKEVASLLIGSLLLVVVLAFRIGPVLFFLIERLAGVLWSYLVRCFKFVNQAGLAWKCSVALHGSPLFLVGALFVIVAFVITRIPFFAYYPIPFFHGDSFSYYCGVEDICKGVFHLSWYNVRPLAYPLLIAVVTHFSDRWLAVLMLQNALSLFSSLCMVYAVYRLRRSLALFAGLAMAGFIGGAEYLTYDMAVGPETLYVNCIVLAFAMLLLGFSTKKPIFYAFSSAIMGYVIWTRPAGLFLIVVYLLILVFMLLNKHVSIFEFACPLPLILLVLCCYNYSTVKSFSLTTFGELNFAALTVPLWGTDPSFSAEVNIEVQKVMEAFEKDFTPADREVLNTSWDPSLFVGTWGKNYHGKQYFELFTFGEPKETQVIHSAKKRLILRQVTLTSILKHPVLYSKFVAFSMWSWYFTNVNASYDFYKNIESYTKTIYVSHDFDGIKKEYKDVPPPKAVAIIGTGEDAKVVLSPSTAQSLHKAFQDLQRKLFRNRFWSYAFFFVLALSTIKLFLSKGRDQEAFIPFILTISVIGASLIVCLSELPHGRYSYPTEFVYYLSPVLLPILFTRQNATQEPTAVDRA